MAEPDFWDRRDQAQAVVREVSRTKSILTPFRDLEARLDDFGVLAELAADEDAGAEFLAEAEGTWDTLRAALDTLELVSFLAGDMDRNNTFFAVHAGAGGTESCDWADMLLRMYTHWFERRGFEYQMIDLQPGDEAGIKSATMLVTGAFAHGYCQGERGVHRLVRISPFDANKRRHTSFAAVDVVAELDDAIVVDIRDADLRIDTYRSSGAGGQHVNKTDSAVRITHLPTGVVVTCQNERSQHKNRATAMKMLRARLYEQERAKRRDEQAAAYDAKGDNAWGSQIRSYVLQPYQMVKDLRTEVETSNVSAVLDGDLDLFVESYLRQKTPDST